MYSDRTNVRFYCDREKIAEKRTALIPREGETVIVDGKSYIITIVVWFEVEVVIFCRKTPVVHLD